MSERTCDGLNGETSLGVELEPPIGSKHQDRWRAERVFRGEEDAKMVESSLKLSAGGPTNGTMPFLGFGMKSPIKRANVRRRLTNMSS